eukprot:TRINITY_DN6573_c4_g1_i1.p1 TRINITY_DN6573_c4_g1~~TRINITY_DN6573_c4_g1_i1.p1  ORF type:complete len:441 (+),score=75.09 TRINITY_DN6573_c4_g1_i1:36-1325(+)
MSNSGSAAQSGSGIHSGSGVGSGSSPGIHRGSVPVEVANVDGPVANQDAQDLEIQVLDKTADVLTLRLAHIESSFANALRRIMLAEVPTLCIDTVEVFQNDSVLHDEMLVHRLGLVPLETFYTANDGTRHNITREIVNPRDCNCDSHCSNCSVSFELRVRCTESTRLTVTSVDLKNAMEPSDKGANINPIHHPCVQDTYPIVLVELARGQEIHVKCVARKGIGKEHSKWSPAATVAMQYIPEINLNEKAFAELAMSDKKRWIQFCPRKVYSFNKQRNKVEVNQENVTKCFFCEECMTNQTEPFGNFKGKRQLVSVRRKRDMLGRFDYIFTIETTGCMTSAELLTEAVQIFYEKIDVSKRSLHKNLRTGNREGELSGARSRSNSGASPGGSIFSGASPAMSSTSASASYLGGGESVVSGQSSAIEDIPWA